ncbi:hypothetical protein DOY81_003650 [Sarcophaga bullata]|nr:hypothetical protein DOY81_003650 [Sarcophaga bullata]
MSESDKEIVAFNKYIPNATTITNKSLNDFPNVKHFFEMLVKNVNIQTKKVGRSFQYTEDVEKYRYFSAHGLFMDYFIRKHLSNQYNINIIDRRTENILENRDDYDLCERLHDAIKRHYEIYKNPDTKALDIVRSIKIVSMSHLIFFGDTIPEHEYAVNEDNLHEIVKYFKSLPYHTVDLNPALGCEYFYADADIIFDNDVIYEIKTSKFQSTVANESKMPLSKFYQPIIYGFGLYKNSGIIIKKFKIYNPLLGDEYTIVLNNIDFELFERVLKYDVEIFGSLQKLLEEGVDLSLFPEENDDI